MRTRTTRSDEGLKEERSFQETAMELVRKSPRTVKISGERFSSLWRSTSTSQETFAAQVGMKRSGVFRLLRPGVHAMFSDNFRRLAEVLNMTPDQLEERIGAEAHDRAAEDTPGGRNVFISGVRGDAQPLREISVFHGISAGPRGERLAVV